MQLIVNSLVAAASLAIVALSFSVIYSTARFFHFAHAAVFTVAAYMTFAYTSIVGLPLMVCVLLGIASSAMVGCGLEMLFFRTLRRKGASAAVQLLVSLGLYVAIHNLISLTFGDEVRIIRRGGMAIGISILGGRVTLVQAVTVVVGTFVVAAVLYCRQRTHLGRLIRAVANDPELARVAGINDGAIVLVAFAIGSALAGVAGVLVALDVDMLPSMGLNIFLYAVVAVVVGGLESVVGIALSALLIGVVQQYGAWKFGAHWQETIVFVVLIFFLLVRPEGFLGKPLSKAAA